MAIKDLIPIKKHLFLCNGGTCKLKGAEESSAAIRKAIADNGLDEQIHTTKTLCNGRCKDGPIVISQPDGIWFKLMDGEFSQEFVSTFLLAGELPEDHFLYKYGDSEIRAAETNNAAENI